MSYNNWSNSVPTEGHTLVLIWKEKLNYYSCPEILAFSIKYVLCNVLKLQTHPFCDF